MTRILAACAMLLFASTAFAQSVSTGRVNVEADEMELGGVSDKAIFRGNVVASRDGTTINSQTLVVNYISVTATDGTTKKEVGSIDATGGVTINTGRETITANSAQILDSQDKLIANGNVKVIQGNDVLRGQKLVVNLKTKKIDMSGGRVKGSFNP